MNQAIVTATAPVPAKLRSIVSIALTIIATGERLHLQEARLDTPLSAALVDHEGRAEAEHDGDGVGRRERPGGGARAQALGGDLGCICVADG